MRLLLFLIVSVVAVLQMSAQFNSSSETPRLLCDAETIGERAFNHISAVSIGGYFSSRAERDKFLRYFGSNALAICRDGPEEFWKRLNGGYQTTRSKVGHKLDGSLRPNDSIGIELLTDRYVVGVSFWRDADDRWLASASPSENRGRGVIFGNDLCPPLMRKMTHAEGAVVERALASLVSDRRLTDAPKPDVSDMLEETCLGHCGKVRVAIQSSAGKRFLSRTSLYTESWKQPWGPPLSQLYLIAVGFTSEADALGCVAEDNASE